MKTETKGLKKKISGIRGKWEKKLRIFMHYDSLWHRDEDQRKAHV